MTEENCRSWVERNESEIFFPKNNDSTRKESVTVGVIRLDISQPFDECSIRRFLPVGEGATTCLHELLYCSEMSFKEGQIRVFIG